MSDPDLLDRAFTLGRVLVTSDSDFLAEAETRQAAGLEFAGIVYAHSMRVSIRTSIEDLEIIAKVSQPGEGILAEFTFCRCSSSRESPLAA
jgi:hypothetical protein